MEKLRIDFKNMLRDNVGEHGLTSAELQKLERQASRHLKKIKEERVKGEHSFLDLPYQKGVTEKIKGIAGGLKSWAKDFVVLGIGGSALGNIALHQALNPPYSRQQEFPRIHVVDTIDPDLFDGLL
ncbi:MAG: glucose-6-phosphate isomerase, partial [Candidatus Brocadiales bacterium]